MIAFIDAHRERFGVEPICRVLSEHGCKIAPNTYHVAKKRPPSPRAMRDAELIVEIERVYDENLSVYGADKIWAELNREGTRVARCTVERQFQAPAPNRLWVADLTYVKTFSGWVYVAFIVDVFSRLSWIQILSAP